jgi:hypothetical protein
VDELNEASKKIFEESEAQASKKVENIPILPSQTESITSEDEEIFVMSSQEEIENSQKSLSYLFPWIDASVSSKFRKSDRCVEILLSSNCQFSTYKCMKQTCSFFTINFNAFREHAEKHEGNHHYCSFCLYDGVNGSDLSDHLKTHKFDRFQCSLCLYRACEKSYVHWHRQRYHPNEKAKILKSPCQPLTNIEWKRMKAKVRKNNWKKFVKPYECSSEFKNNFEDWIFILKKSKF